MLGAQHMEEACLFYSVYEDRLYLGKLYCVKIRLVSGFGDSDNDYSFWTGEGEVATPLFPLSLSFPPYFLPIKKSGGNHQL